MILCLDLGTKTGYALEASGYPLSVGTWVLATAKEIKDFRRLRMDRRSDPRVIKLYKTLQALHQSVRLEHIIFEDVQFASSTLQVQLWASLRAAVWLMSIEGVRIECCPVGTLKKHGAGAGNATKDRMIRSLAQRNPRFTLDSSEIRDTVTGQKLDDNAVDALHLLSWARSVLRL